MQEESKCFEINESIVGLQATQQLRVKLYPKKQTELSTFCQSLTGKSSFLTLTFLDVDKTLVPSSSNTTIDMEASEIVYTIQLVNSGQTNATQIYEQVSNQTSAMYNITFLGDLELSGSIYKMDFHNLDTTSCWSSALMKYYFNTRNAFVQLDVEPTDCEVAKEVTVQIHFKKVYDEAWGEIPVPPFKLYGNGYYTDSKNYTHKNVKHFRLTLASFITNPTGMSAFLQMVQTFQEDRAFQFRLVLKTKDNGIDLEYYYDITQWEGMNQSIFNSQQVHLQNNNLVINVGKTDEAKLKQLLTAQQMKVTLYVNNTQDLQEYQKMVFTSSDYFLYSSVVRIPLLQEWPLNSSQLVYTLYITFYNITDTPIFNSNELYIDELVYRGKVQVSCISQMNMILQTNQICINMYVRTQNINITTTNGSLTQIDVCNLYLEKNQQNSYFVAFYEHSELNLSERTYTFYTKQSLPQKISAVNTFCFKETPNTNLSELMPGSFIKRKLYQAKMLHKYGDKRAFAYFIDNGSSYIIDTIVIDLDVINYMWLMLVVLISITISGVFVYLQVKKP